MSIPNVDYREMKRHHAHFSKHVPAQECVIHFPEEVDGSLFVDFQDQVARSLERGFRRFKIDLSGTRFISSSGIGCILNMNKTVGAAEGSLVLTGVGERLRAMLESLRLDTLLDIDGSGKPGVDDGRAVGAYNELYELMLGEFNLLAAINRTFSQIMSLASADDILPMMLKTLSRQLRCPLAIHLQAPDGGGQALQVESYAGNSLEAIAVLERGLDESQTLECEFPERREAYLLREALPPERWPALFHEAAPGAEALAAPIHAGSRRRALLLFFLPPDKAERRDNLLHLMTAYSSICGMAFEKRQLLAESERREKELSEALNKLAETRQSLVEAGKLANTGVIVASLAHHLNNRLAPILGYSQLLLAKHHGDAEAEERLDLDKIRKIEEGAHRVQHVLDSLIGAARQRNLVIEECRPAKVINTILSIYGFEFKKDRFRIRTDFDPDMPNIRLDLELVEQAFLSLLHWITARQPENGGLLTIDIRTRWDGKLATVEFREDGAPITTEERDILLDPFGITRRIEDGKTLSLLVVSEIVKAHGGLLDVRIGADENFVSISLPKNL